MGRHSSWVRHVFFSSSEVSEKSISWRGPGPAGSHWDGDGSVPNPTLCLDASPRCSRRMELTLQSRVRLLVTRGVSFEGTTNVLLPSRRDREAASKEMPFDLRGVRPSVASSRTADRCLLLLRTEYCTLLPLASVAAQEEDVRCQMQARKILKAHFTCSIVCRPRAKPRWYMQQPTASPDSSRPR